MKRLAIVGALIATQANAETVWEEWKVSSTRFDKFTTCINDDAMPHAKDRAFAGFAAAGCAVRAFGNEDSSENGPFENYLICRYGGTYWLWDALEEEKRKRACWKLHIIEQDWKDNLAEEWRRRELAK